MLERVGTLPEDLGKPETLLADTGYFSEANVASLRCGADRSDDGAAPPVALSVERRQVHGQTDGGRRARDAAAQRVVHRAGVLREPYRAGTFEKSAPSPSAIVGCAMIASRKPV